MELITTLKKPHKAGIKAPFLIYNTKDDRQEIHNLLGKLAPLEAVKWLDSVCQLAAFRGARPGPSKAMRARAERAHIKGGQLHERLVNEIYGDLWILSSQHGLDLDLAVKNLEELVRRKGR